MRSRRAAPFRLTPGIRGCGEPRSGRRRGPGGQACSLQVAGRGFGDLSPSKGRPKLPGVQPRGRRPAFPTGRVPAAPSPRPRSRVPGSRPRGGTRGCAGLFPLRAVSRGEERPSSSLGGASHGAAEPSLGCGGHGGSRVVREEARCPMPGEERAANGRRSHHSPHAREREPESAGGRGREERAALSAHAPRGEPDMRREPRVGWRRVGPGASGLMCLSGFLGGRSQRTR